MKHTAAVIDIHSRKPVNTPPAANDDARADTAAPGVSRGVFGAILGVVRYVAFLVLFWLRGPLRFVLGLVSGLTLLAAPIMWLGLNTPNKVELVVSVAGAGFAAFAVLWFYDMLLLRLSPEPIFLN